MEELEEKYVVTFTEDAHAPQMCMNSITLDTAQTAVYVMTERVNLFNDDENGFRIAVKNAGGQYADFYLVGSYQYMEIA